MNRRTLLLSLFAVAAGTALQMCSKSAFAKMTVEGINFEQTKAHLPEGTHSERLQSAAGATEVLAANKKFIFKIRTKSGSIVGNILIEAKDQFAAVSKLMQRYPGCEILEGKEK